MTHLGRALFFGLLLSVPAAAEVRHVDPAKSTVKVHVFKAGLLSAFGHEHDIVAPIASGAVDTSSDTPQVELAFHATELKALDPDLKPTDRAEVQSTMVGPKVLDAERFPEIRFRSKVVTRAGEGWQVEGELSLHGHTRPVSLRVTESGGSYSGSVKLRQTEFGITPVTIGGGTVKVKDELRLDFTIVLK